MKYINRVILAMAVAALGLAAILTSGPSVAPAATSTTLPAFGHVVIVIGENTDYSSSVGGMTYLDSLANTYGLATNYHADTHPSIGNYFMLTTGQIITNDDSQTPSSLGLSTSQDNIAYEVQKAGKTWKDYEESTNGCGALNSGSYIVRHDPLVYFPNINTESANFVCMSQFSSDVSAGTLPNLSWLSPNGCDDAHDCSLSTFDGFLSHYLTPLLASKYFQPGGDGLLIVVFDENSGTSGNQVEWVGVSPHSFPAFQSSVSYAHENTLRTMAQGLGASFSGLGAAATAAPMSDFFTTTASGSVSLSPTSATLTAAVGSSSTQAFTVTNGTASSVSVTSVTLVPGTLGAEFTQSNNCTTLSASTGTCTVTVKFAPTSTGLASASLAVVSSASSTALTAALTGATESASLSPTSLSWNNVTVGTSGGVQLSTLTNNGTATLTISPLPALAAPFAYGGVGTCGASLAPAGTCTVSVNFSPTATGTFHGSVTVTDSVGTQTLTLTGVAVSSSGGGEPSMNTYACKAVRSLPRARLNNDFTALVVRPMTSAMSISSEPGFGQSQGAALSALSTLVCWQLDPSSHSAG